MRRSPNAGRYAQDEGSRGTGSTWTIAAGAVLCLSQSNTCRSSGVSRNVHGPAGASLKLVMSCVLYTSMIVVGRPIRPMITTPAHASGRSVDGHSRRRSKKMPITTVAAMNIKWPTRHPTYTS